MLGVTSSSPQCVSISRKLFGVGINRAYQAAKRCCRWATSLHVVPKLTENLQLGPDIPFVLLILFKLTTFVPVRLSLGAIE